MSVNKGNRRLLRRLGDSLDTNLIVDGNLESGDYGVEYDTIMKARRKATFENNKFKGVELLNVEKPTAFFLPQNNAYLEFTYDYTVDGIDYENTGTTTIPFKWSIEYDVKLTDYFRQGGYSKLYSNSSLGSSFNHVASFLQSTYFYFNSPFWNGNNIPEVLDVELKNKDYVGKWYKFKMEVETFENETSYISVDYFGVHHEEESDVYFPKFYGVSTTYIGGEGKNEFNEAKYIKNIKIKYNDELILDCPDPVTGKNLVAGGVDATPNNIIYGNTK